jgi:hypothetical protein
MRVVFGAVIRKAVARVVILPPRGHRLIESCTRILGAAKLTEGTSEQRLRQGRARMGAELTPQASDASIVVTVEVVGLGENSVYVIRVVFIARAQPLGCS